VRLLNCFYVLQREDMYAQDSIDLLTNCGIQFKRHDEYGLDVNEFAELLMSSGVVLSEGVRWISFHRYSVISFEILNFNWYTINRLTSPIRVET